MRSTFYRNYHKLIHIVINHFIFIQLCYVSCVDIKHNTITILLEQKEKSSSANHNKDVAFSNFSSIILS
jgi:hypothetical protein